MGGNTPFGNEMLFAALFFAILGIYILTVAVSFWKEGGMEAARWVVVSDVFAFALSMLFWLFWFFC